MERIEIFTGEQRRRRYTPQEKAKFVAMTMETEILKEALEIAQSKKLISRMP
ncbi:hypothetical protein HGP28_03680, partial [Vibrio sp. SM6]|nr:hypothetical protein [Vibrio agarilyticus]